MKKLAAKQAIFFESNLMSEVISNDHLDAAMHFIYERRAKKASPHDDLWAVHHQWPKVRKQLELTHLAGTYQLSPVQCNSNPTKGRLTRWNTTDSIVLKAITRVLQPIIEKAVSQGCVHLKDRGGLKNAVRQVQSALKDYRFVIKSDVASFYDSMQHSEVLSACQRLIKDPRILNLIHQYLTRCEIVNAEHILIHRGIPKGCPLSPLMGALMLKSLDDKMPANVFYVRYMDDWVILTKTRAQCRRFVKKMHRVMHMLHFKLALDKTFIGRIQAGFDFLGYHFHPRALSLARKTVLNFIERITVLYEQKCEQQRISQYVRRWCTWVTAGLSV